MTIQESFIFDDQEPNATSKGTTASSSAWIDVPATACFAEVILPLALPKTYTYAVPTNFASVIQPGCRVEVILGKAKRYAGIVKALHQTPPPYPTKPIVNLLDDAPILYKQQLQLWNWISKYYMCSEGEVMAAALPAHFKLSSETMLLYNEDYGDDFTDLDADEYVVAEALLIRKQLNLSEVQLILDITHVYPVIKRLIDKKVCIVWESLSEKYKTKKENFILLHPQYHNENELANLLNNWSKAPKQMELLLAYLHLYKTEGAVSQPALLKKSGASAAQLKGLIEKGVLLSEKRNVDRVPLIQGNIDINVELSPAQNKALEEIHQAFTQQNVCLLHGVTGSGKTQVYIKLIESFFSIGKQVLYLLPEIALTAQMIRRLQAHFGGHIAIYHSRFSDNERIELWNKVKSGEIRIVLGARSALFLPFKELGFIVVDEEHDGSFKQQDPAPRYHARDTAVYYASLFNAKVLMGSATPAVETYYNASKGKYALVNLNERFGGLQLPNITLIDTRKVAQKGKVMLSPQLKEAIEKTVQEGRQVILFQNRRGYAPYLICGTCGYLPQCKNCDVTLTLHKFSNKLHCHYCGTSYPRINECPACGTIKWVEKNFGTEKIEEMVETEFPQLKVARMDVDSVRGKHAHDNLIKLFEQQRIDILVGTQMVVKGLDFEKVGLVGILDADGLLSFADFRVNERAFQLMEQVSGRAGRKGELGQVCIQTSNPAHPILALVQAHDYKNMYDLELSNRKEFFYPPFSRIIQLTLKHKLKEVVEEAAEKLAARLSEQMRDFIIGPAAPMINRIRNQYLMELLVKLPLESSAISKYKQLIKSQFALIQAETKFKSVIFVADVDTV
ncbi:MAG: replication restart helicase PriA [Ferruginibacter sp.]